MQRSGWVKLFYQKPVGAALTWALSVGLLFYRLPFGTNYADESYYSAMPYAFAIGNKPYVDELGVFQNAGVMLWPFYKAYIAISGSGDGLILFNRYLYFVYICVCSLVAFFFVQRIAKTATACCVAALVSTFAYFNLFAISYNTCGAFGFFCGVLITARALLEPRPGYRLFGASLVFLSAMYGYPGLTPVVLLYLLVVLAWLYSKTPRATLYNGLLGLGAGGAIALGAAIALAAHVGRPGIDRLLAFSKNMGYGTEGILERLNVLSAVYHAWHWLPFAHVALFVALPLACRFLKRGVALVLLAVALAVALAICYAQSLTVFTPSVATIYLTCIPVLAPVCVALNKGWKHGRFVLVLIWLPSFVSMVTLTYTSSNQFMAASLGSLGAVLAGVVSFDAYLQTLAAQRSGQRNAYAVVFASLFISLLVIQSRSLFASAYAEETRISMFTARVHSGPMRGTRTTPAAAELLESIDRDLKTVERTHPRAQTITIFDDFSTGYMSTRLKPRTFANWILWGFFPAKYAKAMARETFGTPEQLPDILVTVHVGRGRRYWGPYVQHRYRPLIKRPQLDYVILEKI